MKNIFIVFLLTLGACSLSTLATESADTPLRPARGYARNLFLKPYVTAFQNGAESFPFLLNGRGEWTAEDGGFAGRYPHLPVGFNYFNNSSAKASFSFAERLFFSDVFDLMRYAVNSPTFRSELLQKNFYENDGVTPRAAVQVLKEIQEISFAVSLAKRPLSEGTLAEATVGGFSHTIWLRDDTDYAREKANVYAAVILHEITHNLGYSHPSQVNYGVHVPVQEALRVATYSQVYEYIKFTPYHENIMLSRVRTLNLGSSALKSAAVVSCGLGDIFHP